MQRTPEYRPRELPQPGKPGWLWKPNPACGVDVSLASAPLLLRLPLQERRQSILELGENGGCIFISLKLLFQVRDVGVQGCVFWIPACVAEFFGSLSFLLRCFDQRLCPRLVALTLCLGLLNRFASQNQRQGSDSIHGHQSVKRGQ